MKNAKNVVIVVLLLMVTFLVVYSKIQLGYAELDRKDAVLAQQMAEDMALRAKEAKVLASRKAAEVIKLEKELEDCKGKN